MPYDLKGRNVLVTGGSAYVFFAFLADTTYRKVTNTMSRSGLGEYISLAFAKEGANVAVNYFNRIEPAENVRKECERLGVKAVVIKAVCYIPSVKSSLMVSHLGTGHDEHKRGEEGSAADD